MFIGDWMERGERYHGDALAVIDADKGAAGRFSYRDMNRRANRLASWLRRKASVGPGDRIAILARNGVEYLDALFACGKLGAILVPLNWRCHPRELVELAAQTTPAVLVLDDEFLAVVHDLVDAGSSVRHVLRIPATTDGDGDPGGHPTRAALESLASLTSSDALAIESFAEILAADDDTVVRRDAIDAEDILLLLFTGGTTGLPKAAQISYRMIAWNTLDTIIHELQRGDITITHTPMFHTGGLLVYTLPLLTLGGTVVIMRSWTAAAMLELIDRERVTLLFCVPAQYRMMMDTPGFSAASLQSIRFFTSGGAPLPVTIIERYEKVHGVVFKQGFGMTEFGPGVFSMAPEFATSKLGSIGQPNYFIDARIVDDQGREAAPNQVGELVLRGPCMCSGYFGRPDLAVADEHGWFHTGDMARRDQDGFYYIADRKKDMFISGGENVYPAEVERVLDQHPGVEQCAVIGVADDRWGEVGKAFVVLRPHARLEPDELIEHCRARLARYKVPRYIEFVPALPMSAAGKVLKRELRARETGR